MTIFELSALIKLMISIPLISICIPAYKNVKYLKRLLESISIQTFSDFEVIITDDSNDNSVSDYIYNKTWNFQLSYFKNEKPLGSPENWNSAVNQSKGEWIKIMHHDDWFSSKSSLEVFVQQIRKHENYTFFFSAYQNIYEVEKTEKAIQGKSLIRKSILKNPAALLASNIIGPPSVTIYKNDKNMFYDKRLQWLVDVDFYVRYLQNSKPLYISKPLINIGIHDEQVTNYSFSKPEIEIPEHLVVLNKTGEECLRNIMVYDAFWRLVRNLRIRSVEEFSKYNKEEVNIPGKLKQIINRQRKLPSWFLFFGPFSKVTMLFSYLFNTRN